MKRKFRKQTGEEIVDFGNIPYQQIYADMQTFGTAKCTAVASWLQCKCDIDGDGNTDYLVPLMETGNGGATLPNYPYPFTAFQSAVVNQICCRNACSTGTTPPFPPMMPDVEDIISDDEQLTPISQGGGKFAPIFASPFPTSPRPIRKMPRSKSARALRSLIRRMGRR